MNNTPVYDYEDAINFIGERSNISKKIIEKVLILEEDYMRSVGIISDEDPDIEWNFQVGKNKREIYGGSIYKIILKRHPKVPRE